MDNCKSPCQICGAAGAGEHYGGISCHSCRVFYYRALRRDRRHMCRNDDSCKITHGHGSCAACRYEKCKKVMTRVKAKFFNSVVNVRSNVSDLKNMQYFHKILSNNPIAVSDDNQSAQSSRASTDNEESSSYCSTNLEVPAVLTQQPIESYFVETPFSPPSYAILGEDSSFKRYTRSAHSTFSEFLLSTVHFHDLDPLDQEKIFQRNIGDFHVFALVLSCLIGSEAKTFAYFNSSQSQSADDKIEIQLQSTSLCWLLRSKIIPLKEELQFDEKEFTYLQLIAVFTPPVNLSRSGYAKVNFLRESYTLLLMKYIKDKHPVLSESKQLLRLSRLLEIIPHVKSVGDMTSSPITGNIAKKVYVKKGGILFNWVSKKFEYVL